VRTCGLLQVKSQGGAANSSKYFKIGIVKQLLACWIIIVVIMEKGGMVRLVVGALIILFGFFIILVELFYTTDTGLRLFSFQLVSVLIIIAGIVLVISTSRVNRNLDE